MQDVIESKQPVRKHRTILFCTLHRRNFRTLHNTWCAADFQTSLPQFYDILREVSKTIVYSRWRKVLLKFVQIFWRQNLPRIMSQQDETWWFDRGIVLTSFWARLICRSRSVIYRVDFQPGYKKQSPGATEVIQIPSFARLWNKFKLVYNKREVS